MDQATLNLVIQAKDTASKVVGGFKGAISSAGDALSEARKKAEEAGKVIATGLAVAGGALTLFAKQSTDFTVDYVRNTRQIARETGTTETEASRLVFALQRMGLSTEDASATFGIFSKNIVENNQKVKESAAAAQQIQSQLEQTRFKLTQVSDEMKKNGDKSGELGIKQRALQADLVTLQQKLNDTITPFQKLGVATIDASGNQRGFRDILLDVADKFQDMPAGIDKTALSMELFGRSGKDMIGFLNKGSEGITFLEKEADRLGLTLNEKTIGAVARLIESQKKLKENTDAIKIAVGTLTTPILAAYNEKIAELLGKYQELSPEQQKMLGMFLAFGGPVAGAGSAVVGFLANLSAIGPKVARLALIFTGWGAVLALIAVAINGVVNAQGGWGRVMDKFRPQIEKVKEVVQQLGEVAKQVFKEIVDASDDLYNALEFIVTGDFNGGIFGLTEDHPAIQAMEHAHNALAAVGNALQTVAGIVVSAVGPAMQIGKAVFDALWPSVQALFSTLWDRLLPALGNIFEAVKRLWDALNPGLMMAVAALAAFIGVVWVAAIWLVINVLNIIISVISFVINIIATLIGWLANLIGWFGNVIGAAINLVSTIIGWFGRLPQTTRDVVNNIVSWFSDLPGRISSAVSGVGNTLQAPFRTAFNAIARFWNSTVGNLSFKAPDWVPGFGGKGFSMPKIPELAEGGIITARQGGMVARLAEAGQDEAVIPLNSRGGSDILRKIMEASAPPQGGTAQVVNITNNNTFTRDSDPLAFARQQAFELGRR